MMKTRITELFGIEYPIIQGGMQHVSKANLVAAVSNAGGLGILTASNFTNKEDLVKEIRKIKELTKKPFGLNISTSAKPEVLKQNLSAVIEEGIGIVETSGANPTGLIPDLKKASVKVFHKIPNARFAKKLEEIGIDAIAVVGVQAGGHPGPFGVSSEIVLHQTLDCVSVPLIYGGGVMDGRGLLSALAYGADGVLMGTRFLATEEAEIHANIKNWMLKADSSDTLMVKSDNPNRVCKGKMAAELLKMEKEGVPLSEIHQIMLTKKGPDAWANGDLDAYLYSMGQAVGMITKVVPVKTVIAEMVKEAEELYKYRLNKIMK